MCQLNPRLRVKDWIFKCEHVPAGDPTWVGGERDTPSAESACVNKAAPPPSLVATKEEPHQLKWKSTPKADSAFDSTRDARRT